MNNNYPFCLISCFITQVHDAAELYASHSAKNKSEQIDNIKRKEENLPALLKVNICVKSQIHILCTENYLFCFCNYRHDSRAVRRWPPGKGMTRLKNTKIEWCDSTFNPITGCLHHCPYCYARTMVHRFAGQIENEKQLYEDDEPVLDPEGRRVAYPHSFAPTFHKHRLAQVRHWKDEKPRNIFVCSMADIFGDWVPEEWITQITDAFKEASQHNYLFLTKNPIRMINLIERGILEERENFWFGTTSTKADDMFFTSETANAFVSVEPMHGPLEVIPPNLQEQLKWVIFGAETGNRKDKIVPEPEWILEAAYNFEQLGIPVFMKDSLIPIIGEENMKREFPEGLRHGGGKNESSM